MRMRAKPWARPELLQSGYFEAEPRGVRGHWAQRFLRQQPLHLELGCGKGYFAGPLALQHPEWNIVAVDRKDEVLGPARRLISAAFAARERPVDNLLLTAFDVERITEVFSPEDRVERIYINFCNPWSVGRDHKHRLTHTRQLQKYKTFLAPGGEIRFKTDNEDLFRWSKFYLREAGELTVTYETDDLHHSDFTGNIITEHEKFFSEQGMPIYFLIARFDPAEKKAEPEGAAD